ncbi:MAG TPA: HD domain-containing protein [Bacteroidales bacterium]|nr:HD domain-containing protein [Bacteroidales bacterium]HRW97750.1 HD domain-containing protein [Bacteroidales bacterium]
MNTFLDHSVFRLLSEVADEKKVKAFVIGGFVRDLFMGQPSKDIDIVVEGSGIDFAGAFARKAGISNLQVFRNFGTAMLHYDDWQVEFVGARKESYRASSRKPVVENGTIEDDQKRRDFTINAMSLSLNKENYGELVDPFGGIRDLNDHIIRTPLDPDITYSDDPLRMMRAIRFASRFGFTIENNCFEAIKRNAERIRIVSQERITDELNKIIMTITPSTGFNILYYTGLLKIIFPEMAALKGAEFKEGKGHKDNFFHTLVVLDNISEKTDNLWLRWAAILHDIGKPATKKWVEGTGWTFHAHEYVGTKMLPAIFRKLRLPEGEPLKYVKKLVALHMRPIILAEDIVTDSAVRRLLFDAGNDIDDLMTLCNADMSSKIPEKIKRYRANFELVKQKLIEIEAKDRLRNWQPPVSGNLIIETFGIKPGKDVGIIKTAIREAILDGVIPNEFEPAFRLMIEEGKKLGLTPVNYK